MSVNKVVYNNTTLIDATVMASGASEYATAGDILAGHSAMLNTGSVVNGTCNYDVNSSSIPSGKTAATAANMLSGTVAYVNGAAVNGTMTNSSGDVQVTANGASNGTTIPAGYHDGSGKAYVNDGNLIATNIRSGITILGVEGTMSTSEGVNAQTKSVTPTASVQTVVPDSASGYTHLSSVTVAAIPYSETANSYGTTVSIACSS